jgi:hypothetical protein
MKAMGDGALSSSTGPNGSRTDDGPRAHFTIAAEPDPQVPLRLLNYFAQRDCLPVSATMSQAHGTLLLQVLVDGFDEATANLIAMKMGSMVLVRRVELSFAKV